MGDIGQKNEKGRTMMVELACKEIIIGNDIGKMVLLTPSAQMAVNEASSGSNRTGQWTDKYDNNSILTNDIGPYSCISAHPLTTRSIRKGYSNAGEP